LGGKKVLAIARCSRSMLASARAFPDQGRFAQVANPFGHSW
jgi:hypothetical protein